jgi:hypothetical protein
MVPHTVGPDPLEVASYSKEVAKKSRIIADMVVCTHNFLKSVRCNIGDSENVAAARDAFRNFILLIHYFL